VVTDQQVRKLMDELNKHGQLGKAAMRAGMDRKTARKYRDHGKLPSELKKPRTWRTRKDPFDPEDWALARQMLTDAPELESKALFMHIAAQRPGRYEPGQLRSFQRKVKRWRATEGPDKTVFFAQNHPPGEALQLDFTHARCLGIRVAGEPFPHLLCNVVLPVSNWQWVTICGSESMAALRKGLQEALFVLGRVPRWLQTDNSTAATHDLRNGKRGFNREYLDLVDHFGMKPRTIAVGESHQNGDVESSNGVLKRRLEQHLLLRGSRDFDSVDDYQSWLHNAVRTGNAFRSSAVAKELACMRPLVASRLAEFRELDVLVTSWSTIRVKHNAYSVPSRLIGERVRVRIFEERLEVWYASSLQLTIPRLRGRNGHAVDYRHVIWSLVRKPAAFEHYRYRADLFPTLAFREAYDALCAHHAEPRRADLDYLRVLLLAASTFESDVEAALVFLQGKEQPPTIEAVRELVAPDKPAVPVVAVQQPDLHSYDTLLAGGA
jgi:hypothetical protein